MRSSTGSNSIPVSSDRGFTLIEVTVAVALLGAALAVIVGLQSRLVDTIIQERNLFRASLYAQYMLTFLDVEQYPPDTGTKSGSLDDVLDQAGYFDDEMPREQKQELQRWTYTQEVQSINFAEFEDVLRRISLTVRWGTGSGEQTTFVYFMVSDPFGQRPKQFPSSGR